MRGELRSPEDQPGDDLSSAGSEVRATLAPKLLPREPQGGCPRLEFPAGRDPAILLRKIDHTRFHLRSPGCFLKSEASCDTCEAEAADHTQKVFGVGIPSRGRRGQRDTRGENLADIVYRLHAAGAIFDQSASVRLFTGFLQRPAEYARAALGIPPRRGAVRISRFRARPRERPRA